MGIMGHAILGDSTYEKCSQDERESYDRMCLHARKLTIPLIDGEIKTFEAPDPFDKTFF
jgi:23S rRNA-/tRNA-specific pseudouridylate synthase